MKKFDQIVFQIIFIHLTSQKTCSVYHVLSFDKYRRQLNNESKN